MKVKTSETDDKHTGGEASLALPTRNITLVKDVPNSHQKSSDNTHISPEDSTLPLFQAKQFSESDDSQRFSLSAPSRDERIVDDTVGFASTTPQMGSNQEPSHLSVGEHPVRDAEGNFDNVETYRSDRLASLGDHEIAATVNTVATEGLRVDDPTVVAVSIDEEEVRRRREQDIFERLPEAEVLPKTRKRRFLYILISVIVILIIIAIILVATLAGPEPKHLVPTPSPSPRATLAPTAYPNDFVEHNSTASIQDQLLAAANHTLLTHYFNSTGGFYLFDTANMTLFAPSDASFQDLWKDIPYSCYPTVPWVGHLVRLLRTHVATEMLNSTQIFEADVLPTASNGVELIVNKTSMTIENAASIVVSDIQASNGYIQVPNRVILIEPFLITLFEWVLSPPSDSIYSLKSFQQLLEFSTSLTQANLQLDLQHGFAMFVPIDSAFASVYPNITEFLLSADAENATEDLLNYHMILYNVSPGLVNLIGNFSFPALNLVTLWFTMNDRNETLVNTARILKSLVLKNGVLNIIDQVLQPSRLGELLTLTTDVSNEYNFTSLVHIVEGPAHLGDLFTGDWNRSVFAPVENAFEFENDPVRRLLLPEWLHHLQSLIRHHFTTDPISLSAGEQAIKMLSGFNVSLQVDSDGNIIADGVIIERTTDRGQFLRSTNGYIFIATDLLLPPWVRISIYEELVDDAVFSTFISLINLADLKNLLNETDGPLTLLAPNNTAFTTFFGSQVSQNATYIQELVLGHIFSGNLYSTELNSTVVSVSNKIWNVRRDSGNLYIGGALVVSADNLASNGLLHVIDRVLPPVSNVSG